MSRKKQEYYYVRSKVRNYQYGVFECNEEGKKKALEYIKELKNEKKGEEFYLSKK